MNVRELLVSYLIGTGVFVFVAVAWVGVQRLWRRVIDEPGSGPGTGEVGEPDVLARRGGCSDCTGACHDGDAAGCLTASVREGA